MADKQLSGFEISQGEPLDIGAEACAQDLKRIISMIDEHLSQETYGDTYVRKRRISKKQATLMALDLDMSGLDGVADAETAAGSLDAKLHAIRTAVSEHCKTDTDDDELEEPELPLRPLIGSRYHSRKGLTHQYCWCRCQPLRTWRITRILSPCCETSTRSPPPSLART